MHRRLFSKNMNDDHESYPWYQALVEASETTTSPYTFARLEHGLRPIGGHLGLEHF
jgi:hypothetical protein